MEIFRILLFWYENSDRMKMIVYMEIALPTQFIFIPREKQTKAFRVTPTIFNSNFSNEMEPNVVEKNTNSILHLVC